MDYVSACEHAKWHLEVWRRDGSREPLRLPYRCRSWRHDGDCRLWRGAQDFVRVQAAIKSRKSWAYLVLTYPHNDWPRKSDLYRAGVLHWSKLRKRLTRAYGRIEYIQTWEAHRSGYPHVNVLVHSDHLIRKVSANRQEWRRDWLEPNAVESGFGFRTWVEVMRSQDAMAGYLVKLASELTGATVKGQVPVEAPRHFRRLRASRGLLPPPHKDPDLTGILHFCGLSVLLSRP